MREQRAREFARAHADLAIREAPVGYLVPDEIEIVPARGLKSPVIVKPGLRRLAWPWVNDEALVLTYKWTAIERASPRKGNCLDEFISLAGIADEVRFAESVRHFARRWGPLEICEHRKPRNHRTRAKRPCATIGPDFKTEPLEAWRRYSRQLRAILLIAVDLYDGTPGDRRDWDAIQAGEPKGIPLTESEPWNTGEVPLRGKARLIHERHGIALALHHWFRYGAVGLFPQWITRPAGTDDNAFEIETTYWGLAGRLAVDLAAALRHPNGLYRCAGCGTPFNPEERRRAGNREKWCDSEECKAEQFRRNSRRYYERKKQRKPKKGAKQ